ncbi:MAG: Rieske 2Fe-2S domain-containing protein [Planctomycetaceae bacterium]|nr:Rieske 2Fe-2S domain-containing protein [Planctomycetaceae bacterium]
MSHHESSSASQEPRRNFVTKAAAVVFGAIVTVVPFVPALGMLLDPLLRKKRAVGPTGDAVDPEGFIKVASTKQLEDGSPFLAPVVADLQNFWNRFPSTPIGAVYLTRHGEEVSCYNARCPHLGCTVNFRPGENIYLCPCHDSSFNPDGTRNNDIPPRDLDGLEVQVRNGDEVWVKFQNFRVGVHEKSVV